MPAQWWIWVKPGSRRARVGGSHGPDGRLVVAVTAKPVGGAANEAVRAALASALRVRSRQIEIVSGATSRSKTVVVRDPPADLAHRWASLLSTVET